MSTRHDSAPQPPARTRVFRASSGRLMALAGVVPALLAGCMRMQTQQQTLEHRPQVLLPDADTGGRVAEVPEHDGASR